MNNSGAIIDSNIYNDLKENYEFNSNINSNIVFLQQREFRKESIDKVNQNTLKDWYWSLYNYNMFGNQSVFRKGYRKIGLKKFKEKVDTLGKDEKIILKINVINYRYLRDNIEFYGILKNTKIAGIEIDTNQSEGLGSIEHDTYRIINNNIPIKVVDGTVTMDDA